MPSLPLQVNLVAWDNGVGLSQDLCLIAQVLRGAGVEVHVQPQRGRGKLRKWVLVPLRRQLGIALDRFRGGPRVDINIMLEHVRPDLFWSARRNIFIPNPEWCDVRDRRYLHAIDAVLAKTSHAEAIFRRNGCPVRQVGFTSADCHEPDVPRRRTFLHVAGRSTAKRTDVVLDAWRRHPEWPQLTVIQHPRIAQTVVAADNIVHRVDYLERGELRRLQNENLFHLCPSETEGFGHYLMEALGVGAIVLTTDAEPMNEMVTAERGILIPYAATRRDNLATSYLVDVPAIEAAVEAALALDEAAIARLSRSARDFYLHNDALFRQRLPEAIFALAAHATEMPSCAA